MAFSQKTVYAMRAIYELSKREGQGAVPISEISEVQVIPARFLENILIQLKQTGIVKSLRGKEGGYMLAKPPESISVGDILRAIEGPMHPVNCLGGKPQANCPLREDCVFLPMWHQAQQAMLAVYDKTSFASLVQKATTNEQSYTPTYAI